MMGKHKVLIRRVGFHIQVIPAHHLILSGALTYKKPLRDRQGKVSDFETIECFVQDGNTLIVPAGLTARVVNELRGDGLDVVFEDLREPVLPDPELHRLPELRSGQDKLLAAIIASDHGIIEGPTGSGKSWIIRQMCCIWPTARIIIIVPSAVGKSLLLQTRNELLEDMPSHEVGLVGAGACVNSRVTCVMDRSLHKADLEQCRLLIFDEVHHAAAPKTAEALSRVWDARRFGFSASPHGRSDRARLETEAMFGPVIYRSTYQEVQSAGGVVPVRVFQFSLAAARQVNKQTVTAMERHAVWRNEDRNGTIAAAVHWVRARYGQDLQILAMVTTVEHAVHLGRYLPDFTLVYGSMSPEKRKRWEKAGLLKEGQHPISSADRERMRAAFKEGALRRVIATGTWGTGVDFPGLGVLVRADAQGSSIRNTQIPGRVTRPSEGKEFGIVVDFDDVHNETLERRSKKRVTSYRKKGWTIDTIDLMNQTKA